MARITWVGVVSLLLVATESACQTRESAATQAAATEFDAKSVSIPIASVPEISRWKLDPENSSAEFVCRHVLTKVRGMFPQPSGTVMLDEANPANSRIEATIAVNGITTGVEERDTHLKSEEFFDAPKFPTITFASTNVSRSGPASYTVTGDLTMHGVTKPVTLAVTASPAFNHAESIRKGIEATTTVNRKDFGLRWEFPGEGAGVVVGDDVQITINAELVLQP